MADYSEVQNYMRQFPQGGHNLPKGPSKMQDMSYQRGKPASTLVDLLLGKSVEQGVADSTAMAKGDSLFARLLPALLNDYRPRTGPSSLNNPSGAMQRKLAEALFRSGDTGDRMRQRATGTPNPSSMQMRPLEKLLDGYFGAKDGGLKEMLHRILRPNPAPKDYWRQRSPERRSPSKPTGAYY